MTHHLKRKAPDTMTTTYEWDIETIDEAGDIVDHSHSTKVPTEALKPNQELVLVKDVHNRQGELQDRAWAYVVAGKLPVAFQNALGDYVGKVPLAFQLEFGQSIHAK